jgi:8-oxo-dGTP pyrophosphatase MutT (NUDIX family)
MCVANVGAATVVSRGIRAIGDEAFRPRDSAGRAGKTAAYQAHQSGRGTVLDRTGRGMDSGDASVAAALVRELREELGAEVDDAQQVFLVSNPVGEDGVGVQHFFACRLREIDLARRSGPEFDDPSRGGYHLDRVDLTDGGLADVDLKPAALKSFVLANRVALLDAVGHTPVQA